MLMEKLWGIFIFVFIFEDDKTVVEIYYDGVWLRDSLWGYMVLVLDQGNSVVVKKVLFILWDYMFMFDQIKWMQDVISNFK